MTHDEETAGRLARAANDDGGLIQCAAEGNGPEIVSLPGGGAIVVYTRKPPAGTALVECAIRDGSGNWVTGIQVSPTGDGASRDDPAVAYSSGNNTIHVVYRSDENVCDQCDPIFGPAFGFPYPRVREIYYTKSTSGGVAGSWTTPIPVSDTTDLLVKPGCSKASEVFCAFPSVTVNPSGQVWFNWENIWDRPGLITAHEQALCDSGFADCDDVTQTSPGAECCLGGGEADRGTIWGRYMSASGALSAPYQVSFSERDLMASCESGTRVGCKCIGDIRNHVTALSRSIIGADGKHYFGFRTNIPGADNFVVDQNGVPVRAYGNECSSYGGCDVSTTSCGYCVRYPRGNISIGEYPCIPASGSCANASTEFENPDGSAFKMGVWDASSLEFDWWGLEDVTEGTDVRHDWKRTEMVYNPSTGSDCFSCTQFLDGIPPSYVYEPMLPYRPFAGGPCRPVQAANGDIYTIAADATPYGFNDGSELNSSDIWMRKWTNPANAGWRKDSMVYAISRTALSRIDWKDNSGDGEIVADAQGWLHEVHIRKINVSPPPPSGSPPGTELIFFPYLDKNFPTCNSTSWNNVDTEQINYVTHSIADHDSTWGWEFPLSEGDWDSRFPTLANDENGLHLAWTQYSDAGGVAPNANVYYRRGAFMTDGVPAGQSVTWSGTVFLDADFVVEAGATLTILPGTKIYVQADYDRANQGSDPLRVEIIVRGRLDAQGTVALPVDFRSTKEASNDEWGGILFDVAGCGCSISGSGLSAGSGPHSRVERCVISNATYGIRIQNVSAPSIVNVTFTENEILNDRHIFVESDIFIPTVHVDESGCSGPYVWEAAEWVLGPGTNVVAANTSLHDLGCVGNVGKVDIYESGLWTITGSAGNPVIFRPETVTDPSSPGGGDDWGGAHFTFYSNGSSVSHADFGYAANPVFLSYPQSVTISDTRIHHFAETGLWAYGLTGTDGTSLERVTVERETASEPLQFSLGHTGVFLDRVDGPDLKDSRIDMTGRNDPSGTKGLRLNQIGRSYAAGVPARPVVLTGNCIQGPGINVTLGENDIGLYANFLRHGAQYPVTLEGNSVEEWKKLGGYFNQPFGLKPKLNLFASCGSGVDVIHGTQLPGAFLLRENRLEALSSDPAFFAFRTEDAVKSQLGPDDDLVTGANQLAVEEQDTKFIYEEDHTPAESDVLNAQENYWFLFNNGTFTQIGAGQSSLIQNRLAPTGNAQVDFSNFVTTTPTPLASNCSAPPPHTIRAPASVAAGDGSQRVDNVNSDVPLQFALGKPHPNPTNGSLALEVAVPGDRLGSYVLEVFDVGGRVVFESSQAIGRAGRLTLDWNGSDRSGSPVRAGIYFLRVSGPRGIQEIRKAVLVR